MSDVPSSAPAIVADEVAHAFPELFGDKTVGDRTINVETTIARLSEEFEPRIREALRRRRELLDSEERTREKYAFPRWEETFEDPVTGEQWTFRQIVQGLIDNLHGRPTEWAWRLNDPVPIPADAHPLRHPGLELTGPWHPLDMAIKQINADVAATMGPDNEDAAPADYVPFGTSGDRRVGLFLSRENERRLLAREVGETTVTKKGRTRTYRIEKTPEDRPTSFHRVPGIHLRTTHVTVDGRPARALLVDFVVHVLNDFGSLRRAGRGLYLYLPKVQNPFEAHLVARLVWRLEQLLGATTPGSLIKFKALYEEANAGRYLPVVLWTWRHWLIGTNVGRWDYTGSLIELWKSERALPDPQNGPRMGMTSPHMMAYQRYNALVNLMAGLKDGDLTHAAPIGGMAAVMLYPKNDPYHRDRHNPVALRAITTDKLRERLIGLVFVGPHAPEPGRKITLADVRDGTVEGRLYDTYRQSWVASPDEEYVRAGNLPLRASLEELQARILAPVIWEEIDGRPVAPTVDSGLTDTERGLLAGLGLVDEEGRITPWVISTDHAATPEEFLSNTFGDGRALWDHLYDVPEGEVTAENLQHAFYMAANYGYQLLNGNLAAAIDDYGSVPGRVVRFMNDLATYRIFVGWLWTVLHHRARVSRDGWLRGPRAMEDGVFPADEATRVPAGTSVTPELFEELWRLHGAWTRAYFEDRDRLAAARIVISSRVGPPGPDGPSPAEREEMVERSFRAFLSGSRSPPAPAGAPGANGTDPTSRRDPLSDPTFPDRVAEVQRVLSRAYGGGPSFEKELTYEAAAQQIGRAVGVDPSIVRAEIEAEAPRFLRSKAPIIMDVLRRQLRSDLYIQHSPRVLFLIADRSPDELTRILDAIYFVDRADTPLFRNAQGRPSRAQLVTAVARHELLPDALDAYDYVYDIFPKTPRRERSSGSSRPHDRGEAPRRERPARRRRARTRTRYRN